MQERAAEGQDMDAVEAEFSESTRLLQSLVA